MQLKTFFELIRVDFGIVRIEFGMNSYPKFSPGYDSQIVYLRSGILSSRSFRSTNDLC